MTVSHVFSVQTHSTPLVHVLWSKMAVNNENSGSGSDWDEVGRKIVLMFSVFVVFVLVGVKWIVLRPSLRSFPLFVLDHMMLTWQHLASRHGDQQEKGGASCEVTFKESSQKENPRLTCNSLHWATETLRVSQLIYWSQQNQSADHCSYIDYTQFIKMLDFRNDCEICPTTLENKTIYFLLLKRFDAF